MAEPTYDEACADLDRALARLRGQVARLLDPAAPRTHRSERTTPRHPRADVLLVDDDPFAREFGGMLREQLQGASVRVVQRADDALDLAHRGTWRVAVLDLHLGHAKITGLDVLAALPTTTRVVLVTGVAKSDLSELARRVEVDAHLVKPFAPDALARVVAGLLAQPETATP